MNRKKIFVNSSVECGAWFLMQSPSGGMCPWLDLRLVILLGIGILLARTLQIAR